MQSVFEEFKLSDLTPEQLETAISKNPMELVVVVLLRVSMIRLLTILVKLTLEKIDLESVDFIITWPKYINISAYKASLRNQYYLRSFFCSKHTATSGHSILILEMLQG